MLAKKWGNKTRKRDQWISTDQQQIPGLTERQKQVLLTFVVLP